MKFLKLFFIYLVLIAAICALSDLSSMSFLRVYTLFSNNLWRGGWLDLSSILGLLLSYNFSAALVITLFGGKEKYWVLGILLIPKLFLDLTSGDFIYFGFSSILAFIGWGLGILIRNLFIYLVNLKKHSTSN